MSVTSSLETATKLNFPGSEIHLNNNIFWLRNCQNSKAAQKLGQSSVKAILHEVLAHEIGHAIGIG